MQNQFSHRNIGQNQPQLDLMFMKHYAPKRCLHIKVAKLRTAVGSAETKLQRQIIQRALQIPNLQREIIRKK